MPSNKGKDEEQRGASDLGYSAIDEDKQHEAASKGGHSAHEKDTAHELLSKEAHESDRRGGQPGGKGDSQSEDEVNSSIPTRGGKLEEQAEPGIRSSKNR